MVKKKKKKKGKSRRYGKTNMEKVRRKSEELESRGGSRDMHDLKQGWNFFWILPPLPGQDECFKEVQQHRLAVCPKAASDGEKPCDVCKEITKRSRKGDVDFVDEMRLKSRGFFNAVRRDDLKKKDPDNVKILPVSGGVLREIAEFMADEDVDISDPQAAILLGIKKKGQKQATRYKVKLSSEPVNIEKYLTDAVLDAMYDLDKARATQPATTKELRKLIRGAADEEDEDESPDFEDDDLEDEDGEEEEEEEAEEDELFEDPDGEEEEEEEEELSELEEEIEKYLTDAVLEEEENEPKRKRKIKKPKVGAKAKKTKKRKE
jgi:hypothetical protein